MYNLCQELERSSFAALPKQGIRALVPRRRALSFRRRSLIGCCFLFGGAILASLARTLSRRGLSAAYAFVLLLRTPSDMSCCYGAGA